MKYIIIIPAHNEEKNIYYSLKSLENQDFQDFDLVVVNDGSSDETKIIVENFIAQSPIKARVKLLNLTQSEHQPGAKVVKSFNEGLSKVVLDSYQIICKFDADIIFPKNYLSTIQNLYKENPKLGMVSGIVKINPTIIEQDYNANLLNFDENEGWEFENISSKNQVRGPIKSYRKECFVAMSGLRPVLGWDNIDVSLAKMHGYETSTDKELWVKHLRPTAYKYKNQKAEKLGEYFYNLGLNTPLAIISSGKSAYKNSSISEFFITMKSFLKQKHPLALSKKEVEFIRKSKWQEMLRKLDIRS